MIGIRRKLGDGAKALNLLLTQGEWTIRRVDSLAFSSTGETRRRISWDFVVPAEFRIRAGDKVAVPLTTFRKRALKRLDVSDGAGNALSVWSTEQNGRLAVDLLLAGLRVATDTPPSAAVRSAVQQVVFASDSEAAQKPLALITAWVEAEHSGDHDLSAAVLAIAETLAEGFLFVVEVPSGVSTGRHLVKASYDDALLSPNRSWIERLRGRTTVDVETGGLSSCASWHLETRTPSGISSQRLEYEVWEQGSDDLLDGGRDEGQSSTAHVSGRDTPVGAILKARLRLAPTSAGLVNQITVGSVLGLLLLLAGHQGAQTLADLLSTPGRSGSVGAVLFSVPAFFLALLARTPEHVLVSRVLMPARLVAAGSALTLWAAGALIVVAPAADSLRAGLGLLVTMQATLLVWLGAVRDVGGQPSRSRRRTMRVPEEVVMVDRKQSAASLAKPSRSGVVARSAETTRMTGMSRIPTAKRRAAAIREIVKRSR